MTAAIAPDTALLVGALFGIGLYLMLQDSFIRILFGVVILGNAVNLGLLSFSGDPRDKVPPVVEGGFLPHVDALPQALILTAIVIGFAVTSFLIILCYRIRLDHRTSDMDKLFRKTANDPGDRPNE